MKSSSKSKIKRIFTCVLSLVMFFTSISLSSVSVLTAYADLISDIVNTEDDSEEDSSSSVISDGDSPVILSETEQSDDSYDETKRIVGIETSSFDEDVEVRLYFWDYADELPDDSNTWAAYLTDPCDDVTVYGLDEEDSTVNLRIYDEEGTFVDITAEYVTEMDVQDNLTAVYLVFTLPAGFYVYDEITLNLSADSDNDKWPNADENLVVQSVIYSSQGEQYGDALYLTWAATTQSIDYVSDSDDTDTSNTSDDSADTEDEDDNTSDEESSDSADATITTDTYTVSTALLATSSEDVDVDSTDDYKWWFDIYYLNESDYHDVSKTSNFTTKYQFEFHNSEDLEANTVNIKIRADLLTLRNGNPVLPSDIGVPYGTPDDPVTGKSIPLNYYYVAGDSTTPLTYNEAEAAAKNGEEIYLVFFNYDTIASGSDLSVQVLYPTVDVMQVVDESTWSLDSTATVTKTQGEDTTTETQSGTPLTGDVDTKITLTSVTKTAYDSASLSYTPGLYTDKQVLKYITGDLPEEYSGDNFDNYIYVVWRITARGSATQAWTLSTEDVSYYLDADGNKVYGSVVGYSNVTTSNSNATKIGASGSTATSTKRTIYVDYYVVVAYDAESFDESNATIYNEADVTATPDDGNDPAQALTATAETEYHQYEWDYIGHVIGIEKKPYGVEYKPYYSVYEAGQESQVDTGSYYYYTKSYCRGYEFTHNISGADQIGVGDSTSLGEYVPYTWYSVTTMDDVIYAYPNGTAEGYMLTGDDYYFSSVTITQTDIGYDVWEDAPADPETATADIGAYYLDKDGNETTDLINQGIRIYAMFSNSDGEKDEEGWEHVACVEWNSTGVITYTFTDEDIAKEPYRIKVVHDTINYQTECEISVNLTLKYDSPNIIALQELYGEDLEKLVIEDISGVSGYYHSTAACTPGYELSDGQGYIQSATDSNYDSYSNHSPALDKYTSSAYPSLERLMMRDNATVILTSLEMNAASYKTSTSTNDAVNERVVVNYMLTAYEGYEVTDEDAVSMLKSIGVSLPERTEVVFYDLLPYGMHYDASVTPTAGRISSLANNTYKTNTRVWDTSNVTVTVDDSDIIENWNNTGRTLVAFHLVYTGDTDDGIYSSGMWYKGWGVSFQAYYNWTDLAVAQSENNIAAFMPDNMTDETEPIYGSDDKTYSMGEVPTGSSSDNYEPFEGADLNGDYANVDNSILYSTSGSSSDFATSTKSTITKLVKADADVVGDFSTTAVVDSEGYYTYEITISNGTTSVISDIVIYDYLEQALQDGRNELEESSGLFIDTENIPWYGTLVHIYTDQLEKEYGLAATVDY